MSKRYIHLALFLVVFTILSLSGCSNPPSAQKKSDTLTKAQAQFLKIAKEELKYDVSVIPDGRTMWVYVPLNDGIIEFKPAPENQAPKAPTTESWSITFLEALFDRSTKTLAISYDIEMTRKHDQKLTYQNKYSEEYSTKQREVLIALTRAYFDVGQKIIHAPLTVGNEQAPAGNQVVENVKDNPMTPIKDDVPPEFFVMVFADIKNGVGIKAINYFPDMKMALSNPPAISNEEYIKRYVFELFGDEKIIGDKTGDRLKTEEIVLGDFLAKQIENRIKYQFTQSGFPPVGEVRDEIWTIVAETFRLYEFKDFNQIKLIDLKTQQESTYDKSQL